VKDAIKAEQALNAAKSQTEAEGKAPSASVQQALKKAIPAEWTAAGTGLFKDDEAKETPTESSSLESDTEAAAADDEDDKASTDTPVLAASVQKADAEDALTHLHKQERDGDAEEETSTQVETSKKEKVEAVPYEWTAAATGTQSKEQKADTTIPAAKIGDEATKLAAANEGNDEQVADEVSDDQDSKKIPKEWTAAVTGTATPAVEETSESNEHADSEILDDSATPSEKSAKVPFEWTAAGVAAQSLLQDGQAPEEQGSASVEEEEDNSKESDVALYSQNGGDYAESDKALFAASFLQINAAPKKAAGKIASLPEQGYEGKGVKHQNMKSITSDWGGEYGPKPVHAGAQGHPRIAVAITIMAITILML